MAAAIFPNAYGPESLGFVVASAQTRIDPVFGKIPVVVIPVYFDEEWWTGALIGVCVLRRAA